MIILQTVTCIIQCINIVTFVLQLNLFESYVADPKLTFILNFSNEQK